MLTLRNKDLVVIDVETSGVNPFRHEVLAVGLVPVDADLQPTEVYVRAKQIEWSTYARKHFDRYSSEWQAKALDPSDACHAIERYLAKTFARRVAIPIGHNVGFDLAFLRRLAFLGGREELAGLSHRAIDTHTLLYVLFLAGKVPLAATTSDGAFRHFGIEIEDRSRHTALGDAKATRSLVLRALEELLRASVHADP